MLLWIHIVLLTAVLAVPVALAVHFREGPRRSFSDVIHAVLPYSFVALLSCLTVSAKAKPSIEWLLPALGSLLLALMCRAERPYRIAWWSLMGAAIFLCVNVLTIVGDNDYTRDQKYPIIAVNVQSRNAQAEAEKALQKAHSPEAVLKEGPVSGILKDPAYDDLDSVSIESEWHTGLTWIYRVKYEKATLWYPGGEVRTGSQRLELRKLD